MISKYIYLTLLIAFALFYGCTTGGENKIAHQASNQKSYQQQPDGYLPSKTIKTGQDLLNECLLVDTCNKSQATTDKEPKTGIAWKCYRLAETSRCLAYLNVFKYISNINLPENTTYPELIKHFVSWMNRNPGLLDQPWEQVLQDTFSNYIVTSVDKPETLTEEKSTQSFLFPKQVEVQATLSPQTHKVLEAMSDLKICDRIKFAFNKKSICLKWGGLQNRSACAKWSKDKVGKDDYLAELRRRGINKNECDELMSRKSHNELWGLSDEHLCGTIKDTRYPAEKKSEIVQEWTRRNYNLEDCSYLFIHFIHRPTFVLIDSNNPAYTAFTSLSFKQLSKLHIEKNKNIKIMNLNAFLVDAHRIIQHDIKLNAYKNDRLVNGICNFLTKGTTEIGVTWDGGIAFTTFSYRYAEQTYEKYTQNPEKYTIEQDARKDPVRPNNIMPFLMDM